ncbi:hypothetical protein [Lunatibacter salilacus]|uniref:hypothetical protein n=1 Tax=Lunatibacter salilacus TaxID=2483804 RepID=UPI00131B4F3B|nr:hypothetical protein [Lunatibacter salilacus]
MKKTLCHRLNCILCLLGIWIMPFLSSYSQEITLEETVTATISEEYLMPNEKLWVQIMATHEGRPTPSKVAYMELLNRDYVPVVQELTALRFGQAGGYLTIPDNLPSDYYLLRIYTRNSPYYSPQNGVFHQLIGIVNPLIPPVSGAKPVNDTFLSKASTAISDNSSQLFEHTLDDEKISLQLLGQPSDVLTTSISYQGEFPLIPTLREEKLYDAQPEPKNYISEIFGHIIHGKSLERVIDTTETFFLSAHGLESKFIIGKARSTGDVFFETGDFSHFNYVIVQSDADKEQLNFVVESPFWQQKPTEEFIIPYLSFSESSLSFLQERMVASQAASYFQYWSPEPIPSNPRLFLPDRSYLLDDYNRFDDMATVIREYVPEVLVRREDRKTVFRSINKPANQVFKMNPLILIDGLPILDNDAFSKFNPLGIKQMEILNRELYLNHKLFEGAIALTSFDNDFGKYDLPKNALFLAYKGIQFPLTPIEYAPVDQQLSSLGSLLLWKTLTLKGGNENITIPIPVLKGAYKVTITKWGKTSIDSVRKEKIIQIY